MTGIAYPLVDGRLEGLSRLRIDVLRNPGDTGFPCKVFASVTDDVLTLTFGDGPSCAVDLSGGPGIKRSGGFDWVEVTAEIGEGSLSMDVADAEVEPCCVLWLMTPLADAVAAGEGPLSDFTPAGDWGWDDEGVLSIRDPEDDEGTTGSETTGATDEDEAASALPGDRLYMVNGVSSRLVVVRGSSSVSITTGGSEDSLVIGRGRRNARP